MTCPHHLPPGNTCGLCRQCQKKAHKRCMDCGKKMKRLGCCALCSAFRCALTRIVNSGCRITAPDHEERVRRYRRLAAKELPLFEEKR